MKKLLSIILTVLLLTNLIGVNYIHADEGEVLNEPQVENVVEETTTEEEVKEEAVVEEETKEEETPALEEETKEEETLEEETKEETPAAEEEKQEEVVEEETPVVEEEEQEETTEEEVVENNEEEIEELIEEELLSAGILTADSNEYVYFSSNVFEYDGTVQFPEVAVTDDKYRYTLKELQLFYADGSPILEKESINVGDYSISVKVDVEENQRILFISNWVYVDTFIIGTPYYITEKELDFTWDNNITYDGENHYWDLLPSIDGTKCYEGEYADGLGYEIYYYDTQESQYVLIEDQTAINPGRYCVKLLDNSPNYFPSEYEKELEIAACPIELSIDDLDEEVYYTGYSYISEYTPHITNLVEGDDVELIYQFNTTSDINVTLPGKYSVTVTSLSGTDCYKYSFNTREKTFVILPCQIDIEWPAVTGYTYDGSNYLPVLSPAVYQSSGDPALKLVDISIYDEESYVVHEVIDAGTYTFSVSLRNGVDTNLYQIAPGAETVHQYTIAPVKLWAKWNTTDLLGYTIKDTFSYGEEDNFYDSLIPTSITTDAAGEFVLDNYNDIVWIAVYDGDIQITDGEIHDVGTYDTYVSVYPEYENNYVFADATTLVPNILHHTFTINTCKLYTEWDTSLTGYYYNGENRYGTFIPSIYTDENRRNELQQEGVVKFLVNGEETDSIIDAGTYDIEVVLADESGNYEIPARRGLLTNTTSNTYTINKKTIYVSWLQQLTGTTYDGNSHIDEAKPNVYSLNQGLQIQEDNSMVDVVVNSAYDFADNPIENPDELISAGRYSLSVKLKDECVKNYNMVDLAGTLNYTINLAQLSLTWPETTTFTYDGSDHKEECLPTISGVVEGEEYLVILETNFYDSDKTPYDEVKDARTYSAVATVLATQNYALPTVTSKDYTINPIQLVLTWPENTEFTYDEKDHKDECMPTITGAIKGEEDLVTLKVEFFDIFYSEDDDPIDKVVNFGLYEAIATITATPNYILPNKNETNEYFYIYQRFITAKIENVDHELETGYELDGIYLPKDQVSLFTLDGTDITDNYGEDQFEFGKVFTIDDEEISLGFDGRYHVDSGNYKVEVVLKEGSELYRNNAFKDEETGFETDVETINLYVSPKEVLYVGYAENGEYNWGDLENTYSVRWNNSRTTYKGYELIAPALEFEDLDGNSMYYVMSGADYSYNIKDELSNDASLLNAGTYTITISPKVGSNYIIDNIHDVEFNVTIDPAFVSVNWTRLYAAYNENVLVPEYEIVGLVPNDEGLIGLKLIYDGDEELKGRPSDIGIHEAFISGFEYIYPSDKAPNECFNYELADGFDPYVRFSIVGDNFEQNEEDDANISSYVVNNSVQLESLSLKCPSGEDLLNILLANEGTELALELENMLFEDGIANVYLTVEDVDPSKINFANGLSKDNCVFFDLTLNIDTYHLVAGKHVVFNVTETGDYFVEITFKINQEQANKIGYASNKDFFVVNNHGDKPFTIKLDAPLYDETTGLYTFTFKTNKFCPFYLYSANKQGGSGSHSHDTHSVPNTITTLEYSSNTTVDVKTCYKKEEDFDLEEEF